MKRNCDYCGKEYKADTRNIKRGWGLCCSKTCAANKREKSKPTYNAERVECNNFRRALWNNMYTEENEYGIYRGSRTSEGYKVYEQGNGEYTAIDEYGDPVYDGEIGYNDEGDDEYWNDK